MSRDALDAQPRSTRSVIETVISRLLQRELTRGRTARQRSDRRRAAAQRARDFDKQAVAAVTGGYR